MGPAGYTHSPIVVKKKSVGANYGKKKGRLSLKDSCNIPNVINNACYISAKSDINDIHGRNLVNFNSKSFGKNSNLPTQYIFFG